MSAELNLVTQLAIILASAGVFTVISKALKQPLILGYIVAGFIVGPHLGLFPQFSPESVHEWSELGVIFLLFGLGLEFNFKKLLSVGSSAMISAVTICIGMFVTGSFVGSALGWDTMESMFLGGMMSMSSTTIIIKAYDDLGIKNKPHANLVFGLLVVEDLLAVLMMVLFSTLAVSSQFSGTDMLLSLGKLVTFLVLCFLVGIYVIPSIFKKASKFISEEILLLISVGLCFIMVVLANKTGFSSALGAFLMGSILSSTIEGERIEHITVNIKNLFGAIFFVSVGMMVDPTVIAQHWSVILIIALTAMAGILIYSTAGALLSGQTLDTALHVGFSLPQLGEFSFIIAGLGCSLGVLRDFIYPVIISVSVITTFTTPYMIKAADPVSAWLHRVLPAKAVARLGRNSHQGTMSSAETTTWKAFLKTYALRVGIYSMILFVLQVGMKEYFPTLADMLLPDIHGIWRHIIEISAALVIMFPFLIGLAAKQGSLKGIAADLIRKDPRAKIPITASIYFRIMLAVGFAMTAFLLFTDLPGWSYIIVGAALLAIFLFERKTQGQSRLERRFLANLNEKDEAARRSTPVSSLMKEKLSSYDVRTSAVTVKADFAFAGRPLLEMPFRHSSGVNIVKIQRGSKSILIPGGGEQIFPGDKLLAVGTAEQLSAFEKIMDDFSTPYATGASASGDSNEEFCIEKTVLTAKSYLCGKLLKDTDMRVSGCMVVCVERDALLHANPDKDFKFKAGDTIWLAGLKSSVDWYKD